MNYDKLKNCRAMDDWYDEMEPDPDLHAPGGTFYIFPKALEEDAKVFCEKALKYDLVLVPGDSFGAPGYFRMAYCIDTEKVVRSLYAMRKFVEETYPNR